MGEEGEEQRKKKKKNEEEKKKLYRRGEGPDANANLFASCSFEDLGLHTTLCDQLRDRMGFKVPTTIQVQAIPVVMSGRHVLINAATGTGKTIVYLGPVVHHLQMYSPRINRSDGTFGL